MRFTRPFPALGIGWILAVIVAILAVLVLLHAIVASELLLWVCILLLALALLL